MLSCEFYKILRTPFSTEHLRRLLLIKRKVYVPKKLKERVQDFQNILVFHFLYHDPSLQLVGHLCHSTERKEKDDMNQKNNKK